MMASAQPRDGSPRRPDEGFLAPALIFVSVLAAWEILTRLLDIKPYLLPSPLLIVQTVLAEWPTLFSNYRVTLSEILLGFVLAFAVAMALGVSIAHSSAFRRGVYPLIIASQTVPMIAVAPVLIIWFGYNIIPRVLVTALIAFFPLTVTTVTGFNAVEADEVNLFRSMNGTRTQIFFKLSLPTALPFIFAGLKVSATLCVIGATVGEWIGADRGLGHLIVLDTAQFDTPRVFASIVLLSSTGVALFLIISLIERIALPWRHGKQVPDYRSLLRRRRHLPGSRTTATIPKKEA